MKRVIALLTDTRATAAIEMALVTPLLCLIMLGSAELGRYFYNEHIMVKAVRDGAVFASRQPIDKFLCATGDIVDPVKPNTFALIKTGALANGTNLLRQWSGSGTSLTMTLACVTAAGGTTLGGIYTANGGLVPVITVTASTPYTPIFNGFGLWSGFSLNASEEASVIGI